MNLWEYLDKAGQRSAVRENKVIPHDFRGWVACGLFVQSSSLFGMMWFNVEVTNNQGFMTLASAVIVTGWIGGVAAFAYSAGKQQGEASALASQAMDLAANANPAAPPEAQEVQVVNSPTEPVPTHDTGKEES